MKHPHETVRRGADETELDDTIAHFYEAKIRHLLGATHGDDFGEALMAISSAGHRVVIDLRDGGSLTLSNPAETAQALLEHFDWKPSIDWKSHDTAEYVHGICQKKGGTFTLRDVLSRLVQDKPEMIRSFGSAWGRLLQSKILRVLSRRRPFLYELSAANSWLY